ncbi:MAG: GNAT family N-acetyltransferase, partial [Roseburia sp.]
PMAGWKPHENLEESREILSMFIEEKKTFAIVWKENHKVIGSVGIEECNEKFFPELQEKKCREIGYVLSKDYWGRGITPEAVKAVIRYCFKEAGCEELTCCHFDTNMQSKRVIEKCGFRYIKDITFTGSDEITHASKAYLFSHKMSVNGKEYEIQKLLGKGKGGYSYLATDGENKYVLKQIHHEPCEYYQFGNKIEAERNDYVRLSRIGILMPELIEIDWEQERILKEYIEGDTIFDLVKRDAMEQKYIDQMKRICLQLYAKNTNIDYYPTNFVVFQGVLYYVDYECNDYMEEWNFENWGIKYWSKTPEFLERCSE